MTNQLMSGVWASARDRGESKHLEVVDCTLRDGEQAPGVWLTVDQKIELAQQLAAAGVNLLDAGFPASGEEERQALRRMRRLGLPARIGATARLVKRDIQAAIDSDAEVVFLFAPVSDVQRERTLGLSRAELLSRFMESSQFAISKGLGVSLVLGDATQADRAYVAELASEFRNVPVERVILADSMGASLPEHMQALVAHVHAAAPSSRLCVHCHNDFGMATANTVAALQAGASSFTATINGIGERAGNADMAEVLAAAAHLLGLAHSVNPKCLPALARTVARMTGIHASPLKPVTGMNVYRHESGIHVDAILKESSSYQVLPPAWTGSKMELVLGKHSGAAQIRALLTARGFAADEQTVARVMQSLKDSRDLCDRSDIEEMFAAVERFQSRVLGGIPVDDLLERSLSTQQEASGAS